jgi:hypothetical protein
MQTNRLQASFLQAGVKGFAPESGLIRCALRENAKLAYLNNRRCCQFQEEKDFSDAIRAHGSNNVSLVQSIVRTRSKAQVRNRIQKVGKG